jgi:hypothetical protein
MSFEPARQASAQGALAMLNDRDRDIQIYALKKID